MSQDHGIVAPVRPGWKFWTIGVVALLWNAIGALDYVMTQTRNETYMSGYTPEQLEYFYGFPAWVVAAWAIAVWSAVLGSVLLLMRKRLAVPVFLVGFIAMVVTTIHNFLLSDGMRIMGGPGVLVFSAMIFLVALGLYLYSRSLANRGVLV
ncbi:MAG: hypothetical protein EHM60_10655 [Lysobacterales bacterium]|jgi:uncharacterized membrane protein YphA (DoxX/SURF4 family)|nr:MAG: hypothetical protein EHM60_10655 [Xanthomonadales bacterium]